MPTPGSPPTRTSEPGTRPPPSTLSNSEMPRLKRGEESSDTADRGSGLVPRGEDVPPRVGRRSTCTGSKEFQASHEGQRPNHLGLSRPQLWQTNTCFRLPLPRLSVVTRCFRRGYNTASLTSGRMTSLSSSQSISTVSPDWNSPRSIASDSWSSSMFCMTLRRGLAPNTGS